VRTHRDRDRDGSGAKRAGNTKTDVVVAVVGLVPVAAGRAEVLWIVVPGTAAQKRGKTGAVQASGATVRGPAAEEMRSSGAWMHRVGPMAPVVSVSVHGKFGPPSAGIISALACNRPPHSRRKEIKG
jgi:hypothetical protein